MANGWDTIRERRTADPRDLSRRRRCLSTPASSSPHTTPGSCGLPRAIPPASAPKPAVQRPTRSQRNARLSSRAPLLSMPFTTTPLPLHIRHRPRPHRPRAWPPALRAGDQYPAHPTGQGVRALWTLHGTPGSVSVGAHAVSEEGLSGRAGREEV